MTREEVIAIILRNYIPEDFGLKTRDELKEFLETMEGKVFKQVYHQMLDDLKARAEQYDDAYPF